MLFELEFPVILIYHLFPLALSLAKIVLHMTVLNHNHLNLPRLGTNLFTLLIYCFLASSLVFVDILHFGFIWILQFISVFLGLESLMFKQSFLTHSILNFYLFP